MVAAGCVTSNSSISNKSSAQLIASEIMMVEEKIILVDKAHKNNQAYLPRVAGR